MIRPKSLRQRLSVFMLFPVALLLIGMGIAGYIYSRDKLLAQWREAAILSLQQAAHQVDMRLSRSKEWIRMFHKTGQLRYQNFIHNWVVNELKEIEGVTRVSLTWDTDKLNQMMHHNIDHPISHIGSNMMEGTKEMMRFHGAEISEITPPRYDTVENNKTVSLISDLIDESGTTIGKLEVVINFDYLTESIIESTWWQGHRAFFVDNTGMILASTESEKRQKLAETNDPLEQRTMYGIMSMSYGTIIGKGFLPSEVSGFYKLQEAPWNLVMIAPGKVILSSLLQFRLYYLIIGAVFIFFILFLIKFVTDRTVSEVDDLSKAADRVAQGDFTKPLTIKSDDEIGELMRSFNYMMRQLEDRIRLKEAMDLAMEVQQNLLPQQSIQIEGLDIAGKSIYCDETGGDYLDFIQLSELGQKRIGIAVGDVVGHGIAAALLMTTVRAFLRCRLTQPGSISQVMRDINRLLCYDTSQSGSFMTMFFLLIDQSERKIQWVRAGHDPAILYDPAANSFKELDGKGAVIGVDENLVFQEYTYEGWDKGQIILIGTDGIWETFNLKNEKFGKDRLKNILRQNKEASAQEIIQAITEDIANFRKEATQDDDITLAVVKF